MRARFTDGGQLGEFVVTADCTIASSGRQDPSQDPFQLEPDLFLKRPAVQNAVGGYLRLNRLPDAPGDLRQLAEQRVDEQLSTFRDGHTGRDGRSCRDAIHHAALSARTIAMAATNMFFLISRVVFNQFHESAPAPEFASANCASPICPKKYAAQLDWTTSSTDELRPDRRLPGTNRLPVGIAVQTCESARRTRGKQLPSGHGGKGPRPCGRCQDCGNDREPPLRQARSHHLRHSAAGGGRDVRARRRRAAAAAIARHRGQQCRIVLLVDPSWHPGEEPRAADSGSGICSAPGATRHLGERLDARLPAGTPGDTANGDQRDTRRQSGSGTEPGRLRPDGRRVVRIHRPDLTAGGHQLSGRT